MTQGTLRDRQVGLTRDLILEALAGLIAEGRLAEFSVQDVADGAGVSLRTVYRHFASREALLDAFLPWAEEQVVASGSLVFPVGADDIPPYLREKVEGLERLGPLVIAFSKLDSATGVTSAVASKSLRTIRAALAEVTGGLDREMAEAVVWTIRMLWSHKTWAVIHEEGGVDARHAGAAMAWAVELMIEALRQGRNPRLEQGGRT